MARVRRLDRRRCRPIDLAKNGGLPVWTGATDGLNSPMVLPHDYRSLILPAGERHRLVPLDRTFDEALAEAVEAARETLDRWVGWFSPDYGLEHARRWLQGRERSRAEGRAFDFAITRVADGEVVGGCGLNPVEARHRFGNAYFWVVPDATGQGLATAAVAGLVQFAQLRLGLVRIEMVVPERDSAAERVAEKVGASREGLLRNRLILQGSVHHAYLFSLLSPFRELETATDDRWERVVTAGGR